MAAGVGDVLMVWGYGSRTMRKSAKRKTRSHTPLPLFFVRLNFAVFVEAAKSRGYRVLQDFAVKAGITVVVIYDEPLW